MMPAARVMMLCLGITILASPPAAAQTSTARASVWTSYALAGGTFDGVSGAYGPGIVVRAEYRLPKWVGLGVAVGFERLHITQDEPVERWEWPYWEIYYGPESRQLRESPDFEAIQTPFQHALVVSAALLPSLNLEAGRLGLQLAAGPSGVYFSRRLYLDEQWSRYYPDIDYTFEMQFRNYAEDKNGFEIGADVRLDASYRISSLVDLAAGVNYRRLFREDGSNFPMNDLVSMQLGLAFTY